MIDFLTDYMKRNSITKADLSRLTGVAAPVIYQLFNKKQPLSRIMQERLLAALNIKVEVTYKEIQ